MQNAYSTASNQSISNTSTTKRSKQKAFIIRIPTIDQYSPYSQAQVIQKQLGQSSRQLYSKSVMRGSTQKQISSSSHHEEHNPPLSQSVLEKSAKEANDPIKVYEHAGLLWSNTDRPTTTQSTNLKAELQLKLEEMYKQRELTYEQSILASGSASRAQHQLSFSQRVLTFQRESAHPVKMRLLRAKQEAMSKQGLGSTPRNDSTSKTFESFREQTTIGASEETPASRREMHLFSREETSSRIELQGLDLGLISLTGVNVKSVLQTANLFKVISGGKTKNSASKSKAQEENRVSVQDTQYTPMFLKQRAEFVQSLEKSRDYEHHKVPGVLMKTPDTREISEQLLIAKFLKSVELFSRFDQDSLRMLGFSLSAKHYAHREYLCHEGDSANGIWILLEGTVAVEKDGEVKGTYKTHDLLGRQALDNHALRTADLVVDSQEGAYIAFLSKVDFYGFLNKNGITKEENSRELVSFLQSIPFFKSFSDLKLYLLGTAFKHKKYLNNEVIYRKGSNATEFYLMVRGHVRREANLSIETMNRWPLSKTKGDFGYRKLIRNFEVSLEILPGEMFGFKEMLYQQTREESVLVYEESEVYIMNREKFLSSK